MRVVITVFHPLVPRNLLYGPALRKLQEAGLQITLLVAAPKKDYFHSMFDGHGIQIVSLDVDELTNRPRNVFLQRLSYLLIRSHYLWYKQVERRTSTGIKGWPKYLFERLFILLFAHTFSRPIFRAIFKRWADLGPLPRLFEELSPDLVVSTDAFHSAECLVLCSATRQKISTLAMVRSWDNCYSKGLLPVLPGKLLTNTHFLKEEAHIIHGMPLEHIKVIGLPQMDSFFNPAPFDRAAFMRKLGADPTDKLIVFAPGGSVLTDIDWQLCEILRDAISNGTIRYPVHVLVRNHPHHPADLSRFKSDNHFTIEKPGTLVGGNVKNAELTRADQSHLYETLAAADVLLWVATTLGIDAAALDRPEIMINFDGYEQRPYHHSVRKFHEENHMKKLVATGGVRVARNAQELVEWINNYLDNPSLDEENRKKIVDTQLVYTDGKAGERFAQAVISALY